MKFTPKQTDFLKDNKSEQIAFIGGFGSGKTFAGCYKALALACENPDTAGALISPTFQMLRDTTRRTFLEILEEERISYEFKITENKIKLIEPNSEVWFRSADDPDKLKGPNLAWVGLDEGAMMHKDAYLIGLSRIRDPKARTRQLFITTTPDGFNWVYDLKDKIKMVFSATTENFYLPETYIQSLYDNYDEQLVKQYVNGEFVLLNKGQVYYAFSRHHNVEEVGYDTTRPIWLNVDFNINPMCWTVAQPDGMNLNVFDEIILPNCNTEMAAGEFRRRYPTAQVIVYGDYSGKQRHTSSRTTDYDIIKEIIQPLEVRIKPNPPVIDRVNAVNALLCNAKGIRRLKVHPKCKHLIRDFEQVIYKEGTRDIDKSNLELTHASDSIGYPIEYEFGLRGKPTMEFRRFL